MGHRGQSSSHRVVAVEPEQVQGQGAQCGQHRCTGAAIAVGILMELGVAEPVPAFNAPSVPHQFQQGFWRGAQAGEKEVSLEGGLAGTLANDDQFDDPTAADPGLADVLRCLFGPEGPGGVAPVTMLGNRCRERDLAGVEELLADLAVQGPLVRSPLRERLRLHRQEEVGPLLRELLKTGF